MLPSDVSSYLSIFLDQFLYSVFKVRLLAFKQFVKPAYIIQAFCPDFALANFVRSFLSRFKCIFLRSLISVGKLPNQLSRKIRLNGDGEIRTLDPLLARQVLSQLSYAPVSFC